MYNISFKAYQSKKLKHIHEQINIAGWIWNHALALQKRYYKIYFKYISLGKMQKHIAKLRNKNSQWKKLNSQSVQEIIERLDTSYKRFFTKKSSRPPRFKKVKDFKSFVLKQSGWKINGNIIKIGKRNYKFSKSKDYEKIKRISVKRNSIGDIYFVLCCDSELEQFKRVGNSTIGIDFGLKTFLTMSDGKYVESPAFYFADLDNIRKRGRKLSRKVKGSKNRSKALRELQKGYINITNKRTDFEWKLAHELCKHNCLIAIEDLNIEGMKKLWGRKVSDLSFSSFASKLEQVALKYGTVVQKIDRFYPSSKLCNSCGNKKTDLTLKDREYICEECGAVEDRDLNAAKNILTEGIRLYRTKCKTEFDSAISA